MMVTPNIQVFVELKTKIGFQFKKKKKKKTKVSHNHTQIFKLYYSRIPILDLKNNWQVISNKDSFRAS